MVLQWCHSGVTVVSRWCYSGVAVVLQWCCSGVTVVLQWCYSGVTVMLQWCYSDVTVVLQWCYRKWSALEQIYALQHPPHRVILGFSSVDVHSIDVQRDVPGMLRSHISEPACKCYATRLLCGVETIARVGKRGVKEWQPSSGVTETSQWYNNGVTVTVVVLRFSGVAIAYETSFNKVQRERFKPRNTHKHTYPHPYTTANVICVWEK
jgi:hypothetical protein